MKLDKSTKYLRFTDILIILFSIFMSFFKEVSSFQIKLPNSIPNSPYIKMIEVVDKSAYAYESNGWVKLENIPKDMIVIPNIYNIQAKADFSKVKVVLLSSLAHNMYYEYGKSKHKGESIIIHIDSEGDYTVEKL